MKQKTILVILLIMAINFRSFSVDGIRDIFDTFKDQKIELVLTDLSMDNVRIYPMELHFTDSESIISFSFMDIFMVIVNFDYGYIIFNNFDFENYRTLAEGNEYHSMIDIIEGEIVIRPVLLRNSIYKIRIRE
jgi:hypothetical protein